MQFVRLIKFGENICLCGGTHINHVNEMKELKVTKIKKKGQIIKVFYHI